MNLLTDAAWQWQSLLSSGQTTSEELISLCLDQIAAHNHAGLHLNAIISTAPRETLFQRASTLDAERAAGSLRSPLHGLPIIIKDVFPTDFSRSGLPTTAGAVTLASAHGTRDCLLVQRLFDAGLIVIATANLTEFCGHKTSSMQIGWSSAGGQTQSPFAFGGLDSENGAAVGHSSPAGSSSGSAVSVAAGFAPLAIGTETTGSLVIPANRAGLFALKVTKRDAPTEGAFALSKTYDSLGGLARDARDLRGLTDVILGRKLIEEPASVGAGETERFRGLRVGFVDMRVWQFPDWICVLSEKMRDQLVENGAKLGKRLSQELGVKVVTGIALADTDCLDYEGQTTVRLVAYSEFKDCFRKFMSSLTRPPICDLKDLIQANSATEISSQQEALIATDNNSTSPETSQKAIDFGLKIARENLDQAMSTADVDLLIGPGDSDLYTYAALAGYPIGAMPLSTIQYDEKNQRPEGLCVIGKTGSESLILDLMEAVEKVSPERPLPSPLLQ